jgi:hypothetical protein
MARIITRLAALVLAVAAAAGPTAAQVSVRVLSSDPARVTGGDALVEVVASGREIPRVTVNGRDVSNMFKTGRDGGAYLGLVTGLALGEGTITARQGTASASVVIVNHPITGPVFAGPKESPFYCETRKFKLADGTRMAAPMDENCSVQTTVKYVYMPKGETQFRPLLSPTMLPADAAETTTMAGETVPYVVRVEAGTINRGIYQIAVLHDPTRELEPTAARPPKAWNRRMVYVFAGGCLGMYRQGATTGNLIDDQFLSKGYLTIANSLNVFQNNCDDLLAAETAMMTRERAIELVGAPVYTLGWGCSGGSHQVLMIADNYPGLLDGIVPMCNSVDWTRFQQFYSDVQLVYDWFAHPTAAGLTDQQKMAIAGTPLNTKASELARSRAGTCPDVVPKDQVYDRENNPDGLRCTITEHQVNSIGRDPKTRIALPVIDNIGVQYGLGALNSGTISVKQFLDLNEHIGGYHLDGERSEERAAGNPLGIENYYRAGRVLFGGLGLKDIPIVELRNYSDLDDDAAHTKFGTYAAMARLQRETGQRANYVVLLESHRDGFMSASKVGGDAMSHFALDRMDQWLTRLAGDTGPGSRAEKMARTKPTDLVDSCWDPDGRRIIEEQTVTGGRCNEFYPTHLPPRMVAGGPLTNDVLKCSLKPVDTADYSVPLTPADLARAKAIFPDGVCDWTKRGVGQVPPKGTWQSF